MNFLKFGVALFIVSAISMQLVAEKPALLKLRYNENYSPTYDEVIEMYKQLDAAYPQGRLIEAGLTDCGRPLHTFVISRSGNFDVEAIRREGKTVVLINNGIHPGEPEGIDASLEFADDILRDKDGMGAWLDHSVLVIIPVYNIGGALNRSAYNRSGQTTPYETGFRGNYGNLDLNRDFTKCDSENARSFTRIFQYWNPDLFLDTHTTNGSDHQHAITIIPPQPDQFPDTMRDFLRKKLIPGLYSEMKKGQYPLIPYVDYFYEDVRDGIRGGQEGPRYSSGYAALFHSYGMMTENLIYASFPDRVRSTYDFIRSLVKLSSEHKQDILASRKKGIEESMNAGKYVLTYEIDTTRYQMIEFHGYEVDRQQISPVTGLPRLGYDRGRPFTASIRYFDTYKPIQKIDIPEYYIVPQAWKPVLERLALNQVEYRVLERDTVIRVVVDYLDEVTSQNRPYNGHFFHSQVVTRSEVQDVRYFAGDWIIPVRQERIRYIIEMLEPKARDSFLRWNFFDSVLDQREYFSSFGFEENALRTLKEFPDLKRGLDEKRKSDPEFARNHRAQLQYIYENSPWLEKTWKRYPVGRTGI
jgi:hypothetical protein